MPRNPTIHQVQRISPNFQKRLLELIEEEHCSKYEFAERANVSKEVINRACLFGIIPSLQSLIKIADHLNVSLPYLLARSDREDFERSADGATFCDRLPYLAAKVQKKYSEIAHAMPFPESYFHDWLRTGTLPSLDYLFSIAEYFHVSPDFLLGRTDDDTPYEQADI